METPPFKRTVCACSGCTANCFRQPGYLIPGDLERIEAKLDADGRSAEKTNFAASPGGKVIDQRQNTVVVVQTITPARKPDGSCVFLDANRYCTIHEVSPFGCAYYGQHMTHAEAKRRSMWGMGRILEDDAYRERRREFPETNIHNPVAR